MTALALVVSMDGCARTVVQPKYEQPTAGPAVRPSRFFVYNFSVTAAEVSENQGFFTGLYNSVFSDTTENQRQLAIARDVQNQMSEDLVAGIRDLGLPAQRATQGTPLPPDAIAVTGLFLNVDEGNRLQRTVIGFGAGGSQVDAQVEVYAPSRSGLSKLLVFNAHADSGRMPGAAVTAGVGAAASGGMTAGAAAANVGTSAVKGYRSQVDQMAGRSADQAVAYLSEFFARQGWIPREKVVRAKRADGEDPRPACMEGTMKQKRNMLVWPVMMSLVVVSIEIAAAQSPGISGMYVFPKRGQPAEQQQQDEMACHSSAVEMTDFNPSAPPSAPPPSQGAPAGSGARGAVRGAVGGAALGATMGAIAGDAGKGAAMGAAGGGIVGGVRGRRQGQQQQAAQQQATQTQQQARLQEYQRAFSACMDARGYSVK